VWSKSLCVDQGIGSNGGALRERGLAAAAETGKICDIGEVKKGELEPKHLDRCMDEPGRRGISGNDLFR